MRNCFARLMTKYAAKHNELVFLYADIGNRLFNDLKEVAPERTINAGIAESNMATVAAGMAMSGLKPFIYTITPFTTSRNFEQIKVDIAYQNLPVTIVGTGSGMSYANLGPTHHSFEDIALMRVLPNMTVLCPADIHEMEALFPQIMECKGPVYFRLGKKNEPQVYETTPALKIGQFNTVIAGDKVAILACGTILPVAIKAAELLAQQGVNAEVVSAHTVKPIDDSYLKQAAGRFSLIATVEEHSIIGGFGSAVLEHNNDKQYACEVMRFSLQDQFMDKMHSQETARMRSGLTAENIASTILKRLHSK
jgi:transketolase